MKKKFQLLLVLLMISMTICFASAIPVTAATPAKPTITVVKKSTDTSVWIKWAQAKNAKKYELFCSVDGGAYKRIAVTMKLYYKHIGLKQGSTYSYKLRAVNGSSKSKYSAVKKYRVPKKNVFKASTNSVYLTKENNNIRIIVSYSGPTCKVNWKSTDEDVATCKWDASWSGDTIGLTITGYKKGKATIVLSNTVDSQKIEISVNVDFPVKNEWIGFDVSSLTIEVGETKTINVNTDNGCDMTANYTNTSVSFEWGNWNSSHRSIQAFITGESTGESFITVYDDSDGSVFATLRINVVYDKKEVAFDKVVTAVNNSQHVESNGQRYLMVGMNNAGCINAYIISYIPDEDALEFSYSSFPDGSGMNFVLMTLKRSELNDSSISAVVDVTMEIGDVDSTIYVDKATYTSYRTPTIVITKSPSSSNYTEASAKSVIQNTFNSAIAGWNSVLLGTADVHINDLGFTMY